MATLTIRNIDDSLKRQLRITAAKHGCSMEEEVRRILRKELSSEPDIKGLGSRINQYFKQSDLDELQIPERSFPRNSDLFKENTK